MTISQLDYAFPFIVLFYGALMSFVLFSPKLMELAEERLPSEVYHQFTSKRGLALVCLVVGAVWSLQNIWLSN